MAVCENRDSEKSLSTLQISEISAATESRSEWRMHLTERFTSMLEEVLEKKG